MDQPLIGVTIHGINQKGAFHTSALYVESIRRAGGIPLLIAPGEKQLKSLVDTLDGFVFTGGGDIAPSKYGGKNNDLIYGVDQDRDAMEFELAERLSSSNVPVLAICRGMQVFCAVHGGTLYEDIEADPKGDVVHRLPEFKHSIHNVQLENDSRQKSILGSDCLSVASIHHQAVDQLPDKSRVTAVSKDGIIEALEFEQFPNLIAVQWHPEITAAQDSLQQKLFNYLVLLAKQNQK